MGDTAVSSVSPSSSTNVVMIATIAIRIGTTASAEANTNSSTTSAPTPPMIASASTPGPSLPPLSSASASKPVTWTGCAGDRRALERVARHPRRVGVVAEVRLVRPGRVDERVHGAAVLRGEDAVAGRGVGRDARAGQRLLERRVDLREVAAHARRLDRLARGQRDDRQQRDRLAAGAAVALGDLDVGDRALLVGHRQLLRERPRGRAGGEDAGDGRGDPEGDDDALVREDPTRERGHARTLSPGRDPAYRECP